MPREEGWVKLNADGTSYSSADIAGCGGVVEYHFGAFMVAFSRRIRTYSALHTELWGLLHGTRLLI